MRLKLKRWVKVLLYFLFLGLVILTIKDMLTKKTIVDEEGKHYVCYGSIIQVCSGENYDIK